MICAQCGEEFDTEIRSRSSDGVVHSLTKYCSRRCGDRAYHIRRRALAKQRLVQLKLDRGEECERCEYDECLAALTFHHRDAETKLFELGSSVARDKSDEEFYAEAEKCDMLCACCHIFIHQGSRQPIQSEQKEGV